MKFKNGDKVWFFDVDAWAIMKGQIKKSRDNDEFYDPQWEAYHILYMWKVPGIKSYFSHANIWREFVAPRTSEGKKRLNKIVYDYLTEEAASRMRLAQSIKDYVNEEEMKSISEKYKKGAGI